MPGPAGGWARAGYFPGLYRKPRLGGGRLRSRFSKGSAPLAAQPHARAAASGYVWGDAQWAPLGGLHVRARYPASLSESVAAGVGGPGVAELCFGSGALLVLSRGCTLSVGESPHLARMWFLNSSPTGASPRPLPSPAPTRCGLGACVADSGGEVVGG